MRKKSMKTSAPDRRRRPVRRLSFVATVSAIALTFALLGGSAAGATALAKTSPPPAPPGPGLVAHSAAAVAALQTYYNASTGLFDTTGWWNSANALDSIIEYSMRTGSKKYLADVSNTFKRNEAGGFLDGYYDDEGWWALTWINAYDLTGRPRYLAMAESIFSNMVGGWSPSFCGGGIWWNKTHTYKNAIANELFLKVAIELYERAPSHPSYLSWAMKEWSWFQGSGMINSSHLINDGLNSSCQNNGETTWTYNQGVILGGLVGLYRVTGARTYLNQAQEIANAAMATLVDKSGILVEIGCHPAGECGADGSQFKGIFMRNLYLLYKTDHDPTDANFISKNAASIWANDRNTSNELGLLWQGPFSGPDIQTANASTQSSALDALNAALPTPPLPPVVTSLSPSHLTISPGASATVTLGATNLTRKPEMVSVSVRTPPGVTVGPPQARLHLAPGSSASVGLRVATPPATMANFYVATITSQADGLPLPARSLRVLVAPPGSLLRSFNNVGISSDSNPAAGDFDGQGFSYSAQALAAAGLRPGSTVTEDGANLQWPVVQPGFPDNVEAEGQSLALNAPLGTNQLVVLGAAANSPDQTVILHYSDGTSTTLWLGLPDWTLDAGKSTAGARVQVVATLAYRNSDTGTSQNIDTYVFATGLPVNPTKTLTSITLPAAGTGASLHLFDLAPSAEQAMAPAVTGLNPSTAAAGQEVTIDGSGFGATQGQGFVTLSDNGTTWGTPGSSAMLKVDSWSDTAVTITLPEPSSSGKLAPGSPAVLTVVTSAGEPSNEAVLEVTPSANPADYYDNVGISPDDDTTCADIDGLGNSYSADALAADGITPGSSVTSNGVTYTWPDVAACAPDNIMADGQTMLVQGPAGASELGLLGTSVNGSSSGDVIVTYTDGTSVTEPVSFGDWFSGPTAADTIVAETSYRNTPSGPQTLTMKLYSTTVPVDPSKTVASVTLPDIGDQVASGVAAMHIFAVALGS